MIPAGNAFAYLLTQSGNGFTIYCMFDLVAGDRNEGQSGVYKYIAHNREEFEEHHDRDEIALI